ncbi:PAS domain-containing protein, partial [Rhizobium sp. rho-1.1]
MQDFTMGAISAQDIVDTLRDGLLVLTSDLTVISANRAFYAMFKVSEPDTVGRKLYDLGNGQWNIDALKRLLEDILPTENSVEGFEVDHVFTGLGRKVMLLNARKVVCSGDSSHFLLLAIDDVTEARVSQIEAERNLRIAQNIVDTIRDPLVILESDMSVVTASRSFLALFNATASQVVGRKLEALGQGQWDTFALRKSLERVVPHEEAIDGFLLEDDFPGIGRRIFKVNAR